MIVRKAAHFSLAMIGLVPWSVAMTCMWMSLRLSLLGDRIWPDADAGNCWSYAMPRWHRRGGYLAIRPSPRPFSFIPHAIWVESLDGCTLEQTMPRSRAKSWLQAWRSFYFSYRVTRSERRPGHTQPAPLGD